MVGEWVGGMGSEDAQRLQIFGVLFHGFQEEEFGRSDE